jgi:hypothetical protein
MSWQTIIFIELTEFSSGNRMGISLQSIEAIKAVPAVAERRAPKLKGMNGPMHTIRGIAAHSVIVGRSGNFYQVNESIERISQLATDATKAANV